MEQSSSWEANRHSVKKYPAFMEPDSSLPCSQEPPQVRIPNHIHPVYTFPPYFFSYHPYPETISSIRNPKGHYAVRSQTHFTCISCIPELIKVLPLSWVIYNLWIVDVLNIFPIYAECKIVEHQLTYYDEIQTDNPRYFQKWCNFLEEH
jgi:hypothetical protein